MRPLTTSRARQLADDWYSRGLGKLEVEPVANVEKLRLVKEVLGTPGTKLTDRIDKATEILMENFTHAEWTINSEAKWLVSPKT